MLVFEMSSGYESWACFQWKEDGSQCIFITISFMLQWAFYPVQQQQHRQRCQPVSEQTERFGLKPQLIQWRSLGCFSKVGWWLLSIPLLPCAKARDGQCLLPAERSLFLCMEELSGSSSSADYNALYPFYLLPATPAPESELGREDRKHRLLLTLQKKCHALAGCCREVLVQPWCQTPAALLYRPWCESPEGELGPDLNSQEVPATTSI